MLRSFAERLAATPVSQSLQDHLWVIPASQSIHILAISVVFGSACMINARLLGITHGRSISQLSQTLLPWMWGGLVILLLTGAIQTVAEPVRQFITPLFWAKMIMIVIVATMTGIYTTAVHRQAARWDSASKAQATVKAFAILSTLLWLGIIVCGRFIGYTWNFYQ